MKTRITVKELMEEEGFDEVDKMLAYYIMDSVVRALCIHGCEVEPDGKCPHGNPSVLLAWGF